jgi:hypothetical protein
MDWRSKLIAFNIRGWLVGSPPEPYEFEGRARPNTEEAAAILTNAFESPEGLRDDPLHKTYRHDVAAHLALRNIYSRAARSYLEKGMTGAADSTLTSLMKLEEAHGRRAIEGLPRGDTPGDRVKQHVLRNRNWLAFFLWHDKATWFPASKAECFTEAQSLFARNLEDLEAWGWGARQPSDGPSNRLWREAYSLYSNYAGFRLVSNPHDFEKLVKLCRAFAVCLPGASFTSEEDRLRTRSMLNSLALHLLDHARYLSLYSTEAAGIQLAMELDQCVLAMDDAWLKRYPADHKMEQRRKGLEDVIERVRRRVGLQP